MLTDYFDFTLNGLDISPDGKTLLYGETEPNTKDDLWLLPLTGPGADRKPVKYLESPGNEMPAQFSPDGKWVAYGNDESGRFQVYVQAFPATGAKYQISVNTVNPSLKTDAWDNWLGANTDFVEGLKAKMPLGQSTLTDDEAFDVAAFINVQPRPEMAGLDKDYPDRSTKPVDTPYGPYADSFAIEQHRLGPFAPIEAFYAKLKGSK